MNNRTLQSLIIHVFLFGASTVSLVWSGLTAFYGNGPLWALILNGVIWLVSLCGARLCYRDLAVVNPSGGQRSEA